MTELVMHEIDGTYTTIYADAVDEHFTRLQPDAGEKCLARDIHLYNSGDGIYYLADKDGKILAVGMTTIRTYIKYMV